MNNHTASLKITVNVHESVLSLKIVLWMSNWKHVIIYHLYVKFPRIFAHNVQMCAKFCCKNFNDVCQVFLIIHHYTWGRFCGHAVLSTVRLTVFCVDAFSASRAAKIRRTAGLCRAITTSASRVSTRNSRTWLLKTAKGVNFNAPSVASRSRFWRIQRADASHSEPRTSLPIPSAIRFIKPL